MTAADCLSRTPSPVVQISGAHFISTLLHERNLPVPAPVRLIFDLVASAVNHLTPNTSRYVLHPFASMPSSLITALFINSPLFLPSRTHRHTLTHTDTHTRARAASYTASYSVTDLMNAINNPLTSAFLLIESTNRSGGKCDRPVYS